MVDAVLTELSPQFERLDARVGRPSIAPEKLLRTLLLQVLYSGRSERLLMEQLDYNLLFHWFVGLNADDPIWDATVFTKNRQRLLNGDIARAFFERVVDEAHDGPHTCWGNRPYAQRADPVTPRGYLSIYITPVIFLYLERFRERASRRREAVPDMALRRVA
jgi:hypothetical protein